MTEDEGTATMQAVDETQLAQIVAGATDQQLEELMASEARREILDDIFRRMAEHVDQDRARDVTTVLHWKIYDRPEGGYDHICSLREKYWGDRNYPRRPGEVRVIYKVSPERANTMG